MNGTITKYVYDNEDIIAEYDGNNQLIASYTHGTGIDEPISMTNGQTYYYHTDALGSVIALTDSTGNVVQRYEYDSFGNIVSVLNPNFVQPYTYTAREYDPETGLYYYRARYYDAEVERFLSEDPILSPEEPNIPFMVPKLLRNPAGLHAYNYVGNNPVMFNDPYGYFWPIDCAKCIYYMIQCSIKGQKCKENKCKNRDDVTSDELWRDCIQGIEECQKMFEYCGKCGISKK